MAKITEDYVSFETAKLLKECGFPQEYDVYHSMVYNEEDYEDEYEVQRMVLQTQLVKAGTLSSYPLTVPEPKCYCPTLQMACKWLREVHKIHIAIYPYGEYYCDNYQFDVYRNNNFVVSKDDGYITYEESCEAAIKYCLENLIK